MSASPQEANDRSQDASLAAAVALGWRLAEVYSCVNDLGETSRDTLLPAHGSLAPHDQLELQLRAAAGDAERAGVTSKDASLDELCANVRANAGFDGSDAAFRADLRRRHVEINKDLWSRSEALGKAYELGNGLSDTYGLVCRAYREEQGSEGDVWSEVFDRGRIERLKRLLDDLQSRLDPTAVTVVRKQLDAWCEKVEKRLNPQDPPKLSVVRTGLRRQTVIWCQLIAGDKRPEDYLDAAERTRIRHTLRNIAWMRYRIWLVALLTVLGGVVFFLPELARWYQAGVVQTRFAPTAIALAGAVGITRASFVVSLRARMHQWAELLWQCAVVEEVVYATLTLEQVFPAPATPWNGSLRDVTARAGDRLRGSVALRTTG
jgi:hypothetical protein